MNKVEEQYYWRNKDKWIEENPSQTLKDYFNELENRGFQRICPTQFRLKNVLVCVSEHRKLDGVLIHGMYSMEKGGMRNTLEVMGAIADELNVNLYAYVSPFTLTASKQSVEQYGYNMAIEESFARARNEDKQSPDGLSREEIKEALGRYGYDRVVLPPDLQDDKELQEWLVVREPSGT